MRSSSSQKNFLDKSQDITSVRSEGNNLPADLEVHDDHDNDRGLELGSLSLQANSTPCAPTEEAIAVDSVNRLPVEMLSEIFLACTHTLNQFELREMDLERIPSHHHRLVFAPNAIPYTVSSVCKRWRSIGLSTPKLWSKLTIPITAYYATDSQHKKFMIALRTWLKRSKNHPLQFNCAPWVLVEDEVFVELFNNIHRWHAAYFACDDASDLARQKRWFGNDGLKAENLETLEFEFCNHDLDIAFQRFPNLRRLRIHPDFLAVEEARSLSLTHLALIKLEGNTAVFFSYLRRFPSLINFEAPVYKLKDDWGHPPLTPFTHSTLTELTFTWYNSDSILGVILANIHLPSIRRLCIQYALYSRRMVGVDVINDFIRRHESTFTDLELSGLETYSDEMIENLRMFPKYLTSYQSELRNLTDECVKRLTLDPLDPAQDLAPNLSSISLDTFNGPSGDLLVKMILSRWARNPHTTFELKMGYYTGPNPVSDSRIAIRLQHNPGLLLFTGWQY